MKIVFIALALALLAYIGYTFFSAKADQPINTVHQEETNTTMEMVREGTYTTDTTQSILNWEGRKTLIANYKDTGTLALKEGNITIKGDQVTGTFIMDMNTIKVLNTGKGPMGAGLEKHLKGEGFFDVTKHPTTTFDITKTIPDANVTQNHQYTVTGNLTMKGITHEITFPAQVYFKEGMLHAKGTMEIDRTKWDIRYGSDKFFDNLANNVIDDNFTLSLHIMAPLAQ